MGSYDFHGELIDMPEIDDEGAENFDSNPTEMNMEVGLGRHDMNQEFLIHDHAVVISSPLSPSLLA